MQHHLPTDFVTNHAFLVYPAAEFRVTNGVNHGDPVAGVDDVCLGDGYSLKRSAQIYSMDLSETIGAGLRPVFSVSDGSQIEVPGTRTRICARLTFMTQIGASVDALVIACDAPLARNYLYPLGPIETGVEYTLIAAEDSPREIPLADLTGMSFGRGTRITMSDGSQRPVERLQAGDRVLTRDNGMQEVRWVGTRTVQGAGEFAPVVISQGAMGNAEDITVSQQHRMLVSDWRAEVMVGSKDVLISAIDLVNDDTIYVRKGGFVEYTQLVFDQHQILYAEGVPTESLHMSQQILNGLPEDVAIEVLELFPDLPSAEPKFSRVPLKSKDAANLLRQTGRL
ncbi:Hint domain-containing protein [Litoreibacter janthinus]|uniref:Hint domain-containing protein n=1 Tax=Litoreibacter janthinus TaxID=670154 RepID=A0A1I6HI69_9RHOB|nr:Hint domain-containing protein [Litoreibacter janthinus]SFR54126.1 Hint domain-containing protein [Litoreibacter janthinus]